MYLSRPLLATKCNHSYNNSLTFFSDEEISSGCVLISILASTVTEVTTVQQYGGIVPLPMTIQLTIEISIRLARICNVSFVTLLSNRDVNIAFTSPILKIVKYEPLFRIYEYFEIRMLSLKFAGK